MSNMKTAPISAPKGHLLPIWKISPLLLLSYPSSPSLYSSRTVSLTYKYHSPATLGELEMHFKHSQFGYGISGLLTQCLWRRTKQVFVSLIVSLINVLVNLPMLINLIVDIVFASGIITQVPSLIGGLWDGWCRPRYQYPGDDIPEPNPKCKYWMLVSKILTGIAAGLGGILG